MKQFVGRTAPSADALHTVVVFYTNGSGPLDVAKATRLRSIGRLNWSKELAPFGFVRSLSSARSDIEPPD